MKPNLLLRRIATRLYSILSHQKQASNWRRFFLFPMKGDPGYRRDLAKNTEFQVELIEEEFNEMIEEVNKLIQLIRVDNVAERCRIKMALRTSAHKGPVVLTGKDAKLFVNGQPFQGARLKAVSLSVVGEDSIDQQVNVVRGQLLKEMADVAFTLYQLSSLLDMNLSEALNRVYVSNMSKIGNDGQPVFNERGKAQKTENYFPPDLSGLY